MSGESLFIKLMDVSPEDVPTENEWDQSNKDAAVELANDIQELISNKYTFDTDGVAVCVNEEYHENLNEANND